MIIKNVKTAEGIFTKEICKEDTVYEVEVNGKVEKLSNNNRVIRVTDQAGNVLTEIQAIDNKQIVVKPTWINASCENIEYKIPTCPICGHVVYNMNWCSFCGQKLEKLEIN